MKKSDPDKTEPKDVPADNPEGTMKRFTEGLKRVLSAPKTPHTPKKRAPSFSHTQLLGFRKARLHK